MPQDKLTATTRIKTNGKVIEAGETFTPRDEETAESLVSLGVATRSTGEAPAPAPAPAGAADSGESVAAPLQQTVPAPAGAAPADGGELAIGTPPAGSDAVQPPANQRKKG